MVERPGGAVQRPEKQEGARMEALLCCCSRCGAGLQRARSGRARGVGAADVRERRRRGCAAVGEVPGVEGPAAAIPWGGCWERALLVASRPASWCGGPIWVLAAAVDGAVKLLWWCGGGGSMGFPLPRGLLLLALATEVAAVLQWMAAARPVGRGKLGWTS